jgi:hypothetical protein
VELLGARGRRFSLLALTSRARVTLRGFDYELEAGRVLAVTCLGLGNQVVADEPLVRMHAGQALLLVAGDGSQVAARPVTA